MDRPILAAVVAAPMAMLVGQLEQAVLVLSSFVI
jgi:hypothetical protein